MLPQFYKLFNQYASAPEKTSRTAGLLSLAILDSTIYIFFAYQNCKSAPMGYPYFGFGNWFSYICISGERTMTLSLVRMQRKPMVHIKDKRIHSLSLKNGGSVNEIFNMFWIQRVFVDSKTRRPNRCILASFQYRMSCLCAPQANKENCPGHLFGCTSVCNQHVNGRREHGPRWTDEWSAVYPWRLGCSVLAVVGLRDPRLNSVRTIIIQGMSGKTCFVFLFKYTSHKTN